MPKLDDDIHVRHGLERGSLEAILDRMPVGIAVLDRDATMLRCNETWARFISRYGYSHSPTVVPGARLFDLIPNLESSVAPLFARALAGEVARCEALRDESGGSVSYWDCVLAPLSEDGKVSGVVATATEATERVLAYQELQRGVEARGKQLSSLLGVVRAANKSLDLDKMLPRVARAMAEAVGLEHCGIYLVDEAKGILLPAPGTVQTLMLGQSFQEAYQNRPLDPSRDRFTREALERKEPVVCTDAQTDPRTDKDVARLLGLKSILAVPFVAKDQVVAVAMVTTFDETHEFTDEQIELARGIASGAAAAVDNARLYSETRRRADEIETLFSVQQAITSRLDRDVVLQLIADEARRLTGAGRSSVFLLDGSDLVLSVISGDPAHGSLVGYRMPVRESLTAQAMLSGKAIRVADAPSDPRVYTDIIQRSGVRSFVCVPLMSGHKPIGTILSADKTQGTFGQDDERVLTLLASSAVIALENSRLYREEHERHQEDERRRAVAEGLRDILSILNSNRSLGEILDYIVAQAGRLLGTDSGAIYRLDPARQVLAIQASHGLSDDHVTGVTIPVGQGVVGRAVQNRQPAAISDMEALPSDESAPMTEAERKGRQVMLANGLRSILAVPLIVRDEVYGGIVLYYHEPREFSSEEVDLAQVFGNQAALTIENARLMEKVEETAVAAERSRLARDLHDAVTQTLFSASLLAEVIPKLWERNPDEGRRRLEELRQLTRGALAEMRTLLLELRPSTLTEAALSELLRQLADATNGRARIPVSLSVEGETPLEPEVKIALYRIAQEAINNVAKHSGASQASIRLACQPGLVELTVSDNGRGCDLENVGPDHLGLGIMRERAEAIGATLVVNSRPGQGTEVALVWHEDNCVH